MRKRIDKIVGWLGGSTTSRFGVIGFLIAVILFAIPSAFYYFKEGGVVMPTWVGTSLGIFMVVVLAVAIVCLIYLSWRWSGSVLKDTTPQRLSDIEQRLSDIEQRLSDIEQRLSGIEKRLANIEKAINDLTAEIKRQMIVRRISNRALHRRGR